MPFDNIKCGALGGGLPFWCSKSNETSRDVDTWPDTWSVVRGFYFVRLLHVKVVNTSSPFSIGARHVIWNNNVTFADNESFGAAIK